MSTTPMFAPDGSLGDIPQERVAEATKAGFKPGVELVSPKGIPGVVPLERSVEAMRAGFVPRTSMANMPGAPPSRGGPPMQPSNLGIAMGSENQGVANPQQPAEQFALQHPEQQLPLAASAALGAGGTAAVAAAPSAIPVIQAAARAHPIISTMMASEAISQARKIPYLGKFIPPYSEMIPMLMGGGKAKPEPEGVSPPPVRYSTTRIPEPVSEMVPPPPVRYSINDIRAKATAAAPVEPEAIAADRYQEVRLTGPKVPAAQGANPQLPEMVSSPSTTIAKHGYDPGKQQMFITFKNGNTYRYSGVPQEVYDQYSQAESHGSFHSNNIKGRYQTDLVSKGQQVSRALGQTQLYGPASNAAFNRMNPPEDVPENWGVDYSPAVNPLDADKFAQAHAQARAQLGNNAPMDDVIALRNKLAGGVPQGDVGSVVRGKMPSLPRGGKK